MLVSGPEPTAGSLGSDIRDVCVPLTDLGEIKLFCDYPGAVWCDCLLRLLGLFRINIYLMNFYEIDSLIHLL